jgi:hypothetical protein
MRVVSATTKESPMPLDVFRMQPNLASLPLHLFLSEHVPALTHAARLLGGQKGGRLVLDLIDDLQRNPAVSRRGLRLAHRILDLLQLEHVEDPDRDEGGYFAAIDPSDPVVTEICVLSDGFAAALRALEAQRAVSHILAA